MFAVAVTVAARERRTSVRSERTPLIPSIRFASKDPTFSPTGLLKGAIVNRGVRKQQTGSRPHLKVAWLGAILLGLMTVVVGLGVLSLSSIQREFETFAEEDFPAFDHLLHVDRDLFRAQRSAQSVFLLDDPIDREAALAESWAQVERTEVRWASYLEVAHGSAAELTLQDEYELHRGQWLDFAARLTVLGREGRAPDDAEVQIALQESEVHFLAARERVHRLEEEFYEPLVENGIDAGAFDTRLLLVALLAGGLIAGGLASLATVRATKRQYLALRQRALHKRFRTLVESAHDVITVVSGDDSLTVMSGDLGVLQQVSANPDPSSMRELLRDIEYKIWASADRDVLQGRLTRSIELSTVRNDGTTAHIEGQGSPMADDPLERVWVWSDITDRKGLEVQLSHQAFHDPLTGVANRSLLYDRVEHALALSARSGSPVSVLFCDLDDFKTVNDSLGHGQGDNLLKTITTRIAGCVRATDTLARLGGDEFAVLLEGADITVAVALAERILAAISCEVELSDRKIFPSMSIGIAGATTGMTAEELLRNSDLAMYAAKHAGKGRVEVYREEMYESAAGVFEMRADLATALEDGQFRLHYQPTVALADGTVEGVEALIRWEHPIRGEVGPDEFIPIAEATGMIIAIGRWVIDSACAAAVELQAQHERPIVMAVNLSPQQLRDHAIVETVRWALAATGWPADRLVLEVTEGSLLDDPSAVQRLHELRELGTSIAIDDFGTGYSSISYLQKLPVDIVKIDRSFVSGDALGVAERLAFLQAIVGLAKSLNLRSVAEGIEEPGQLAELRALGCDTGQGFLWSPATSLPAAAALIREIDGQSFGVAPSDPAASDPAASDPAASDPAASDPAASDPAASDPGLSLQAASGPSPA